MVQQVCYRHESNQRILAGVNEMSATVHAHRCEACAAKGEEVIWIHSETCKGVVQAHKCPKCGEVQWKQFLVQAPQHNHAQPAPVRYDNILAYCIIAVGIALLLYTAIVYVKKLRGKSDGQITAV